MTKLSCEREAAVAAQGTGTEHADNKRTNALDAWIEVLREVARKEKKAKDEREKLIFHARQVNAKRDALMSGQRKRPACFKVVESINPSLEEGGDNGETDDKLPFPSGLSTLASLRGARKRPRVRQAQREPDANKVYIELMKELVTGVKTVGEPAAGTKRGENEPSQSRAKLQSW